MTSYSDQLRERLAQISESSDAATTWEQLKRARERQRQASLSAIQSLQAETNAYNQRLANYAQMYGSGKFVVPSSTSPATTKKTTKKKKKPGSLGSAFGSAIGDVFGNLYG